MSNNKPVKGIFFDLGWTIFRPATGDWMLTAKAMEYIKPEILWSIPQEKLCVAQKSADACLKDEIYLTEEEEFDRYRSYYRSIAEKLPEIKVSQEQADIIAYDRVHNDNNYVFYTDAKKTLEELKGKYKIGVISSTDPSIKRVLKNVDLYDCFDNMTLTNELGLSKPSHELFEYALGVMKLPSQETVFIDDHEKNLDGAAVEGIQPILIISRPDSRESTKYMNIRKLSDLLNIL